MRGRIRCASSTAIFDAQSSATGSFDPHDWKGLGGWFQHFPQRMSTSDIFFALRRGKNFIFKSWRELYMADADAAVYLEKPLYLVRHVQHLERVEREASVS